MRRQKVTENQILDTLWSAHRETPFAAFTLQRKLDLRHDDLRKTLNLLSDLSESGEVKNGYRIKRVASTVYKMRQAQQTNGDTPKGKPLSDDKESLTGASESDLSSSDAKNGENHTKTMDDPYPYVPAELKARHQWVVWRQETRDDKPTKVPYQVKGHKAQTNNPQTWTDYQSVCNHRDAFSGIGFVFSVDDPYCGIDLDNCLDTHGKLKAWAEPIVDKLKPFAYGEVSPSGKGIKFWTRATLPEGIKHKVYIVNGADAIEAYDRRRYFTVTRRGKGQIRDGQDAIDWLVKQCLMSQSAKDSMQAAPLSAVPTSNLSIDEVVKRIRESKQCRKFDALMQGNTTRYGSQSEADCGLCGIIAFWTQDPTVIDAIFRQSRLMRPKWDTRHYATGETYGQHTIAKALSGNKDTYTPRRKPLSPTRRRLHLTQKRYGGRR